MLFLALVACWALLNRSCFSSAVPRLWATFPVVNLTGRGAIIDEEALVENLKSGKVFAAGLDVLAVEPMDNQNPLFSFPNVVITPHIGFNTEEAEYRLSEMVVENIKSFLAGRPQHVVSRPQS